MDLLLLSFLFIVETVLIPYGVTRCRLRHYIHPSLLVVSVLFFVGETLVRWVLLLVPVPADPLGSSISTGRVLILAVFRLFKGWVIGLFLSVTNSVTAPDHQGSAVEGDQEYYFHDCSDQDQYDSSEDVEVEILDPAGTVVPCDHDQYWNDATDHEQGNACRSVVLSSDYASTVLPVNANVIVQQYRQKECFVEEGCLEWGTAEGEREAEAPVVSCRDNNIDQEQRRDHDDPSALHENMLQPAASDEAIWGEQLNDHVVALPMILQIGSAEEESKPSDSSTTESDQSEGGVELDDVILTFPFLRLTEAGILEGVAEDQEPDPAAFNIVGSQLDADDESDVQEREAASSSFWAPIEYWNEDASEEGDDALQAAAETSLAIRVLEERDGQHDMFYGQYTKKMGWFDRLNCERIHQASALLKMDVLDLSFLEKIESKIRSLQGTTAGYLIRGVERDLEHVYVAQSCLCWAVLRNQYYRTVESTLASSSNISTAGPALISRGNAAGKFQQFRVLLHRYMENECREVKRFWSYCSSRCSASNLLQVPDVSADDKAAGEITATASVHMLEAIEKAIQVFWDFLESDNCRPSGRVLKKLLRTHGHPQVDDARDLDLLHNLKKEVRKKGKRLKNLQKTRRPWWKKTTPKVVVETRRIKMLFKLIEVKLVSRVLSMSSISAHQLRWCQDMMESIDIINNGREMSRFCNENFLFPSS